MDFLHCLVLFLSMAYSVSHAQATTTVIVGAGISGIMAAKTLSDNGVKDFLILEATDRIGGRMYKKILPGGYTIEFGANWVEGVGGKLMNPIWLLAQKYKLRTFLSDCSNISNNIYKQKGGLYSISQVSKAYEMASNSSDFASELSQMLRKNGKPDISILSAQRFFGHVPRTPLEMAIDFFFYDAEIAEPPRYTSLENVEPILTFEKYGKDEYFVADSRGYQHIVYMLAKEFLNTSKDGSFAADHRLQLSKVVRKIQYSKQRVTITTEDGSTFTAKNAIVSVSLGVLQTDLIKFEPELPVWKRLAISKFDMTDYCKIFMKFSSTFWPVGPGTEFFMYAHEKRGYYNFWQHLEREYPGGNLLMVTVTDEESKRIEEQTEEETRAEIMQVLRAMFGKNIPEMEAIIIPKWGQDRFFRGTYSNWAIGASLEDFNALKAPVGPVFFTGEHTSQELNGFVHGAYLEGIACAKSVLKWLRHGFSAENSTVADTECRKGAQEFSFKEKVEKGVATNHRSNRSKRKAQRV